MGEGWTVVRRGHRSSAARKGSGDCHSGAAIPGPELTDAEIRALVCSIFATIDRVRRSSFYKTFHAQIASQIGSSLATLAVENLVIYGLGSISRSENSRLQLALALLLLKNKVLPPGCKVWAFDPVITASEWAVLRQFGCWAIDSNELGHRRVEEPTCFFMPHCDALLYENVVKANWGSLGRIAILGNSFSSYKERWIFDPNQPGKRPDHLLAVQPLAREHPVAEMDFSLAFNDMSWHFFPG